MKLQYMCLDSALALWSPGHSELGFFTSRIRRSFAGLLRPLETVSKASHKFDVNVFNNRKIHKVFAQSRSI